MRFSVEFYKSVAQQVEQLYNYRMERDALSLYMADGAYDMDDRNEWGEYQDAVCDLSEIIQGKLIAAGMSERQARFTLNDDREFAIFLARCRREGGTAKPLTREAAARYCATYFPGEDPEKLFGHLWEEAADGDQGDDADDDQADGETANCLSADDAAADQTDAAAADQTDAAAADQTDDDAAAAADQTDDADGLTDDAAALSFGAPASALSAVERGRLYSAACYVVGMHATRYYKAYVPNAGRLAEAVALEKGIAGHGLTDPDYITRHMPDILRLCLLPCPDCHKPVTVTGSGPWTISSHDDCDLDPEVTNWTGNNAADFLTGLENWNRYVISGHYRRGLKRSIARMESELAEWKRRAAEQDAREAKGDV